MSGTIKFHYDVTHDVVVAAVDWTLETEADVNAWYEEYAAYFRRSFKTKKDVIFDLSRFHVGARVGSYFGKQRAKLLAEHTNRSYRVAFEDRKTKTFAYTSSVLYDAPVNEFPDVASAMRQLIADRAADRR